MATNPTKKPRKTAAQRRAEQLAHEAALDAEFDKDKATFWKNLFSKAMQLRLATLDEDGYRDDNYYFFRNFDVNAIEESFTFENETVTQYSLTRLRAGFILESVEREIRSYKAELAAREAALRAAKVKEQKRDQALAKLTHEDIELLREMGVLNEN